MGSPAYDAVVAALPGLTAEERARVAERLKAGADLAGAAPARAGVPDEALDLLAVIAEEVLRFSGERVSAAGLARTAQFPAFRAKARELAAFAALHAQTRAQRRALMAAGVELLRRDLARAGLSVTSRTLMSCVHQVPAVLARAFPGYAEAGLLRMVVGAGPPANLRLD